MTGVSPIVVVVTGGASCSTAGDSTVGPVWSSRATAIPTPVAAATSTTAPIPTALPTLLMSNPPSSCSGDTPHLPARFGRFFHNHPRSTP